LVPRRLEWIDSLILRGVKRLPVRFISYGLEYAKSVEPRFFQAMIRKYGDTVQQVLRTVTPRRGLAR
jgi:hypothetical protein